MERPFLLLPLLPSSRYLSFSLSLPQVQMCVGNWAFPNGFFHFLPPRLKVTTKWLMRWKLKERRLRRDGAAAARQPQCVMRVRHCCGKSAAQAWPWSCSPSSAFVTALWGFRHGKMEGVENSHSGTIAIPTHKGSWDFSKVMR